MSFLGRHIFAGAAVASLAACTTAVDRSQELGSIRVAEVSVDTSTMLVEGRELPVSRAEVARRLENAILTAVSANNDPDGTVVNLNVVMTEVRLAPPLERVVAGTSSASGTLSVIRADTGAVVGTPFPVTGNTTNIRLVGIAGLATTVTPEQDYRGTVAGFAEVIRQTLFGSET